MSLGKPREETTFASNPGGIRLKPLHYARFFPDALLRLVLGGLMILVAVLAALATKGVSALFLYFGVRRALTGWRKLKSVERHYLKGCALPGVVVATDPIVVASLTDLSTGEHATYNTVKVVPMPKLAKVRGRKFATGDRVPVIALYSGRQPTPKWDNFYPSPTVFATDDPVELARVEASIPEEDWIELNEALFSIPKPYRNGLFPVAERL